MIIIENRSMDRGFHLHQKFRTGFAEPGTHDKFAIPNDRHENIISRLKIVQWLKRGRHHRSRSGSYNTNYMRSLLPSPVLLYSRSR